MGDLLQRQLEIPYKYKRLIHVMAHIDKALNFMNYRKDIGYFREVKSTVETIQKTTITEILL